MKILKSHYIYKYNTIGDCIIPHENETVCYCVFNVYNTLYSNLFAVQTDAFYLRGILSQNDGKKNHNSYNTAVNIHEMNYILLFFQCKKSDLTTNSFRLQGTV